MPPCCPPNRPGCFFNRVLDGGTFGFLSLRPTGMYVFPKVWDLNPSAGFGLTYYQLSGGS